MNTIWIYSLLSVALVSLISLIGAITISLSEKRVRGLIFALVALSVGALFGDVFIHILPELYEESTKPDSIAFYVLAGILLFFILEKFFHWHHSHPCEEPHCEEEHVKPVGNIILFSDALHNFIDGIIIGASYLISIPVGIATTIAVILHEIPQELGDFGVLLYSGYTKKKALFFNFLSASVAFLGVLIPLIFGGGDGLANIILPIAAGGFIYIAGSDLIPELHGRPGLRIAFTQFIFIVIGITLMFLLTFME